LKDRRWLIFNNTNHFTLMTTLNGTFFNERSLMKKNAFLLVAALVAGLCGGVVDGVAQTGKAYQAQGATMSETEDMTQGEVRKIDKEVGKLTLKHGRIANLNMPPMTMVFRVKDKSMLNTLQEGDTILFKAVDNGGVLTITEIKKSISANQ
jgi:Cu/Ag efflux protein CusF